MTNLRVSFEFFPPKTEKSQAGLLDAVDKLSPLNPHFVSVTYGAGGSTRERTHETVAQLVRDYNLQVAAHITCVAAPKSDVDEVLRAYWDVGVKHIVALRGDPPDGVGTAFCAHPDGYASSVELIDGAQKIAPFEISVGCYPERHPDAASLDDDVAFLKRKVDAGATRAITQFFYDNDHYWRFMDDVSKAGINVPIVPGIMPITNFSAVKRMAGLCGASVPARLLRLFENLDDEPATRQLVSASVAAEQCLDLAEQGVDEFHFYTLNRDALTFALCHMLGVRADDGGAL